ncbi:MAG: DUF4418 family protein [Anaerolineae bacterium]|jgi:hypothetical protein
MRAIGVILVALALVIGIVPQFTDCWAQGSAIALPNGNRLPMRCHWTRQAEVAVAFPLGIAGLMVLFTRRRQTLRALLVVGLALGIAVILVPAYLIGVCASDDMICSLVMKPTLLFAGILTVATNLAGLVYLRGAEPDTLSTAGRI